MLQSVIQIDTNWNFLTIAINDMGEVVYKIVLNGVAPGVGQGRVLRKVLLQNLGDQLEAQNLLVIGCAATFVAEESC